MPIITSTGHKTNASRFKLYDIANDRMVESRRYATLPAIESIGAIRSGPLFEIPWADFDSDGFTAVDYIPVQGA